MVAASKASPRFLLAWDDLFNAQRAFLHGPTPPFQDVVGPQKELSKGGTVFLATPFCFLATLHMDARYEGSWADIIFMREGVLGKFSTTLPGRLWYLQLRRLLALGNHGLSFTFMMDCTDKPPWSWIAKHQAAVFFPAMIAMKQTAKELLTF